MNCKIPYTKDIDFERKVHEITSISLEHEIKIEENTLQGSFIISGDFKSHEVSVNKEAFSYILPFEIDITQGIDKDTIEFMIDDFTYEVIDNHILKVNIDFNVIASPKEVEEEKEDVFRDASELFFEEDQETFEQVEEMKTQAEIQEVQVTGINEIETIDLKEQEKEAEIIEVKEERQTEDLKEEEIEERDINMVQNEEKVNIKETQTTIIDNLNENEEYATYHIHMVSDGESVETICTMYNSNLNILADYNDLNELTSGDKLIIPEKEE